MKTLEILLLLTLVHLLLHTSAGLLPLVPGRDQSGCCLRANKHVFRLETVSHARMSGRHCKLRALIVTTQLNLELCVDPDTPWSKKCLAVKGRKSNVTATGSSNSNNISSINSTASVEAASLPRGRRFNH